MDEIEEDPVDVVDVLESTDMVGPSMVSNEDSFLTATVSNSRHLDDVSQDSQDIDWDFPIDCVSILVPILNSLSGLIISTPFSDSFSPVVASAPQWRFLRDLGGSCWRHHLHRRPKFSQSKHKDKDVRLLVGICLCEVIRVLAPNPGFSEAVSRDIFSFLLSIFEELDDTDSPFFSKRAKLLETVAKLRFCLVMLDIGCEDLVIVMFESFFSVVRENHPQSLISSIISIITSILEEKAEVDTGSAERSTFQSLLDVVLENIVKGREDVASASFQLAVSVVQNCGEKVERCICQLLKSCILNRDAVQGVIKESYHEIIFEVYQIAPQIGLSVIPLLTDELLTDQVDVWIKVLNLIRKLLAFHGQKFSREYPHVFSEFLNRFSDKSAWSLC